MRGWIVLAGIAIVAYFIGKKVALRGRPTDSDGVLLAPYIIEMLRRKRSDGE